MFKSKSLITGKIRAIVWEWTPEGRGKLSELQQVYGKDYKRSEEYAIERLRLRDHYAQIKLFPQTKWQRLWKMNPIPMVTVHHNIVTNEGDALIADLLQNTPERTKLDSANAVIGVGTGFTAEAFWNFIFSS